MNSKKIALIKELLESALYHVDTDGSVWTKKTTHGRVLNNGHWKKINEVDENGAEYIKYKTKKISVCLIVYQKFCGELETNMVISHRDGNEFNNSFKNLIGERKEKSLKSDKAVLRENDLGIKREIALDYKLGLSQKKIMAKHGVSRSIIQSALKHI